MNNIEYWTLLVHRNGRWENYEDSDDYQDILNTKGFVEENYPSFPIRIVRTELHDTLVYEDLKGHVELIEEV